MTCQDLHTYFESDRQGAVDLLPHTEVTEHIAGCVDCNRFVEEQMELKKYLGLLRGYVPQIPSSLDDRVVAKYRSHMLERLSASNSLSARRHLDLRTSLAWAAAVTFATIVAGVGMFVFGPNQQIQQPPPAHEIEARQQTTPAGDSTGDKASLGPHSLHRQTLSSNGSSRRRAKDSELVAQQSSPLPTSFEGLMYCDQISCPGALEVIRVQLSAPAWERKPGLERTNDTVFADVLVGPDGIARGIRVVQ
jgi:hypothetical protein